MTTYPSRATPIARWRDVHPMTDLSALADDLRERNVG